MSSSTQFEDPSHSITFLKCKQPLVLTKTWSNGHLKDYDTAKFFTISVKQVGSFKSLVRVLNDAMRQPQYAAIRGTPTTTDTNNVTRTLTNFEDAPKHWVMFDADDFTPTESPLVNPAACVEQWIAETLPKAFHNVQAYWQLSASAGHSSRDPKKLRAHVWFWLNAPVTGFQWKRWAEANSIKTDKSVLSPVQLHYTAAPVIEKGADPHTKRSGIIEELASAVNVTALKMAAANSVSPTLLDNGDQQLRDPTKIPGIVGKFNTAVSILDVVTDILPDVFSFVIDPQTNEWDGRRLNFTGGSGGTGGAYIHSDGLHLINMQNHAPHSSQGKALNAFDLVRIYKFGDQDPDDPFLMLDVTTLPSHKAMTEFVQEQQAQNVPVKPQTSPRQAEKAKHVVSMAQDRQIDLSALRNGFPPPYPGVMSDMVQAVLASTKVQQPELTILGMLMGMAGGCGGHYYLPSGMRLNLYGLNISPSGSGKDTIRYAAKRVTDAAMATVLGCPASGQGLQDALPEGGGCLIETDEAGHLFAGMNAKNGASYSIELAKVLLELFSAGQGTYRTRLKAKSKTDQGSRVIRHPAISFFGSSTSEKLASALTADNVTDGLIGRFLFAMGRGHAPFKWETPSFHMPESVKEASAKLAWAPGIDRPIVHADGLSETMETWAQEYWSVTEAKGPFMRAFATRSIEKIERVAGVLAVWDDPVDPIITHGHAKWAKQLVDASNTAVVHFLQTDLGGTPEDLQKAMRVLGIIQRLVKAGASQKFRYNETGAPDNCVFKSGLMRFTRLDAKTLDAALATLEARGDVELVTLGPKKAKGVKLNTLAGED
jgi:hypothetical protein